jgi:hypothetical protein
MFIINRKSAYIIFFAICVVGVTTCSKYKNYSDPYIGTYLRPIPGSAIYDTIRVIAKGANELLLERIPLGNHVAYVNLNAIAKKDKFVIPSQSWVVYLAPGDCWFCETSGAFIRWKISGYGKLMNENGGGLFLQTDIYEKENGESDFEFVISEEFLFE